MKFWRWVITAVAACALLVGAAVMLGGVGIFRDIERTENLVVVGWTVIAFVSIVITVLASTHKKKKRQRLTGRYR